MAKTPKPDAAEIREMEERNAAALTIMEGTIAPTMINSIMKIIERLAIPYPKLSETQQGDIISQVSSRVRAQLASATTIIAAGEHPTMAAKLVDFSIKGTTVKVKLEAVKSEANLLALARIGEGVIDIIFTDLALIDDRSMAEVKPVPQEPDLPLDLARSAGGEPPADDSDLAGEPQHQEVDA